MMNDWVLTNIMHVDLSLVFDVFLTFIAMQSK